MASGTGQQGVRFGDDEVTSLLDSFVALGVKPKASSKEELAAWMIDFAKHNAPKDELPKFEVSPPSRKAEDVRILPGIPRISTFSGDESSKSDVSFDVWKFEVEQLLTSDHRDEVIRQAVFRSLKGPAGKVAMRLGHTVSMYRLITKLQGIFDKVEETQDILAEFYSIKQKEKESVAEWSCRLEDLLQKAIDTNEISRESSNDMLRTRFYSGLRSDLKLRCAHKYDATRSFEDLVIQVRRVEHELDVTQSTATSRKETHVKAITSKEDEYQASLQVLTDSLRKLTNEFTKFRSEVLDKSASVFSQQQPSFKDATLSASSSTKIEREEPTCFRCGQRGHVRIGCRVKLANPLNKKTSLSKGSQ